MARTKSSSIGFWLFVAFSLITAFLLIVKETWLEEGLARERQGIHTLLGPAAADAAEARAYTRFRSWFVDTGAMASSFNVLVPAAQRPQEGKIAEIEQSLDPLFVWLEGRLRAFWLVVFQVMYRVSISLTWWPFTVLTFVPFSIDAISRRLIKANTFDHASPTLQALGARAVALALISYPLLLLAPFALPAQAMPLLIFVCAAATWFAISHFVKRA